MVMLRNFCENPICSLVRWDFCTLEGLYVHLSHMVAVSEIPRAYPGYKNKILVIPKGSP
jgi:hypothetical protein